LDKLNVQLVFSALPTDLALELEPFLRDLGKQVFSNSAAHRMSPDVPLIIPELNPDHIMLLSGSKSGFIACSTNCTVMPIALPLKPLWDVLGFNSVEISTEQSLSGGGYELLKSTNGFVSEIPGEAEKISEECLRLLGSIESDEIKPADFNTEVECKRVMRDYGHIVKVKIDLQKDTEIDEIKELMSNHTSSPQILNLPSAPKRPIILSEAQIDLEKACWAGAESDDCNPATDLKAGMAITVYDLKLIDSTLTFSAFSENTIRGAAGGCLLLAELAMHEGLLDLA
jgi:aspartate-semialdehyde dehydrogenase